MNKPDTDATEPADLPAQALAQVAAWRAQSGHHEPLRLGLIEALARRTSGLQGPARGVLEARLTALLAEHRAALAAAPAPATVPRVAPLAPSALSELVARLSGAATDTPAGTVLPGEQAATAAEAPALPTGGQAPTELKTVRYFRSTWQRLGVRQRLTQSLAQVPDNAGPLNTQRLLNQALRLMDEQAPDYLRHLVGQVETLLWLEQASGMAPPERKGGKRQPG